MPPVASSRDVFDPFAEPPVERRRASGTSADPLGPGSRAGRPPRQAPPQPSDDPNDPAAWADLGEDWTEPSGADWEDLPAAEPARRSAPTRRSREAAPARTREPARERTRPRPSIALPAARLPAFAGRADLLGDQISGILIGANLLSLVIMIVRMATLIGQLPPSLAVHLDAAGFPDGWATPTVLWRLPLIAGMSLLMNLVVAWFIAPIDRFAARFALAAALGVQLIVWIAVLDFV